GLSPVCADLHDKIMALIEEAYAVIANTQRRKEYRAELLGHAKLKFGAEFLYKQAHLNIFRGEIEKGRKLLESAIDIMPSDEYMRLLRQIGG
ncbi:MAG: hypothetical protein FJ088_11510, partial [Deltaproteobacteria bacterium]|nr:hypothetical protein [Deltaproteobacteria bacterium]